MVNTAVANLIRLLEVAELNLRIATLGDGCECLRIITLMAQNSGRRVVVVSAR